MTVYHVAPDGDDSNSGSESDPFATFAPLSENASHEVGDGDTIRVHGGTISIDKGETGVFWHADGLTIEAYGDDNPEIDATRYSERSDTNIDSRPVMWFGQSENVTVRGLEIHHAPAEPIKFEKVAMNASVPFASINEMKVGGHVVDCTFHHNGLPLMWGEGRGGVAERVESYANFGPKDASLGSNVGGDADGIQFTSGPNDPESHRGGAVIECSLHHNSDDGLDLYRATGIVIRDSVAYANGYNLDGKKVGEAPGKGFKLGGGDEDFDSGGCLIHNCAAWMNGAAGIGFNGSNLPNDIWHCTVFGNARTSDRSYEKDIEMYTLSGPSGNQTDRSTLYNNIAEQGLWISGSSLDTDDVETNNFNSQGTVRTTFDEIGFKNTDIDEAGNPTDWSAFLRLDSGSSVIDTGTPTPTQTEANQFHNEATEFDYVGDAPDRGAYAYDSDDDTSKSEPDFSLSPGVIVDDAFVRRDSNVPSVVVGFRNVSEEPCSFNVPVIVGGEQTETRSVSLGTLSNGRLGRNQASSVSTVNVISYSRESADATGTVRIGPVSFSFSSNGEVVIQN